MAVDAKVASAYIDLVARTEAFEKALDGAKVEIRKWSGEMRKQTEEARGAMALLGEEIGIRLPRHVRSALAEIPAVAKVVSVAFDSAVVIGFGMAVFEAGEKLYEFIEKNEEAARKNAEMWEKSINSGKLELAELDLANIKLENHIAKLEHKPENELARAIAEAAVQTERLDEKLRAAVDDSQKLLKESSPSFLGKLFEHAGGSGYEQTMLAQHKLRMAEAVTDQDKLNESISFYNSLVTRRNELEAMSGHGRYDNDGWAHYSDASGVDHRVATEASTKLAPEIESLKVLLAKAGTEQSLIAGTMTGSSVKGEDDFLIGKADQARAAKAAAEKAARAQAEAIRIFIDQSIGDYRLLEQENERVSRAIEETWTQGQKEIKEFGEDIDHSGERWKQYNESVSKAALEATLMNGRLEETRVKIDLATGAIGPHAAAVLLAEIHVAAYTAQLKELQDQLSRINSDSSLTPVERATQGQRVKGQIDALGGAQQIQQLQDSVAEFQTAFHGAIDGIFDEVIRKSRDTAQQLKQIGIQVVDSLNTEIAKAMTGQKTDFTKVFMGAAQSLSKTALEKVEGLGLQALGVHGGKLGTPGNPMHTVVDNFAAGAAAGGVGGGTSGAGKSSGVGGIFGGILGPFLGMLNDSNFFSGLAGGNLFGSGSLFGGGHALGGAVAAGVPIDVGEMGRERFIPQVPGRIVPHNQMGGGGLTVGYLDARGTDPVQSQMAMERGYHAAVAHGAQHGAALVAERARRRAR